MSLSIWVLLLAIGGFPVLSSSTGFVDDTTRAKETIQQLELLNKGSAEARGRSMLRRLQGSIKPSIAGADGKPGTVAKPGQFPYIAVLFNQFVLDPTNNSKHYCGGALISSRLVMTAAHCTLIDDVEFVPAFLRVNITRTADNSIQRKVKWLWRHPKYVPSTRAYDVALIQLDRRVDGVPFAKLAPEQYKLARNQVLTVMGFGVTPKGDFPSKLFRYTTVKYIPTGDCESYFLVQKGVPIDKESLVCAGSLSSNDACRADSGGPLITREGKRSVQVGIVSFGITGCGNSVRVGGYTSIMAVRHWVMSIVDEVKRCDIPNRMPDDADVPKSKYC